MMKVWRAVGESYKSTEDGAWIAGLPSQAIFVTDTEEGAIAWVLHLWHCAKKHRIDTIEVSNIRDKHTLEPVSDFAKAGKLCEFVKDKTGGFNIIHHDFELMEAVVLPEDLLV